MEQPQGKTGEAAGMRPRSLSHDWMFSTRAGARRACIEVESRQTPKKAGLERACSSGHSVGGRVQEGGEGESPPDKSPAPWNWLKQASHPGS